jgi:hypothetical protein
VRNDSPIEARNGILSLRLFCRYNGAGIAAGDASATANEIEAQRDVRCGRWARDSRTPGALKKMELLSSRKLVGVAIPAKTLDSLDSWIGSFGTGTQRRQSARWTISSARARDVFNATWLPNIGRRVRTSDDCTWRRYARLAIISSPFSRKHVSSQLARVGVNRAGLLPAAIEELFVDNHGVAPAGNAFGAR